MNASNNIRSTQLRLRCEQQRQQLAQVFVDIETRLHSVDRVATTVRNAVRSPRWWLASLAGLWALKRSRVGWLFGRGWLLWVTARRLIRLFRD